MKMLTLPFTGRVAAAGGGVGSSLGERYGGGKS
jgi:hypothetical protein